MTLRICSDEVVTWEVAPDQKSVMQLRVSTWSFGLQIQDFVSNFGIWRSKSLEVQIWIWKSKSNIWTLKSQIWVRIWCEIHNCWSESIFQFFDGDATSQLSRIPSPSFELLPKWLSLTLSTAKHNASLGWRPGRHSPGSMRRCYTCEIECIF